MPHSPMLRVAHVLAVLTPAFAFIPNAPPAYRSSHLRGSCKFCPSSPSSFSPPASPQTLQQALRGGMDASGSAGGRFTGVTFNGNQTQGLEVCTMLDEQIQYWNAGDIDGFLVYYWQDDRLTFTSRGAVRQGWDETKARYQAAYGGKTSGSGSMGLLRLVWEQVTVTVTGAETAWVLGVAGLTSPGEEEESRMRFTLILRRVDSPAQGARSWVIEHDHTSEIPPPAGASSSAHSGGDVCPLLAGLLLLLAIASSLLSLFLAVRLRRKNLTAYEKDGEEMLDAAAGGWGQREGGGA